MRRDLEKIEAEMNAKYPQFSSTSARPIHFILNDRGEPIVARSSVWTIWMEQNHKPGGVTTVKKEWVENVEVSTVFLGLNYNWGDGPPILWETMTFSNRKDWNQEICERCSGSREQALAQHERICSDVRAALSIKAKP